MSEEKLRELYVEVKAIDEAIGQLHQQLQMILAQQQEMKQTVVALTQFEHVKQGSETFVPLGSGIFTKATLNAPDKLLVNVGAGVAVSKSIPDTRSAIQDQITQSETLEKQLTEQLEKLTSKSHQLRAEMKTLMPS